MKPEEPTRSLNINRVQDVEILSKRRAMLGLAAAALLPFAGCASWNIDPLSLKKQPPDGLVDMQQVLAASADGGRATLYYLGKPYRFPVDSRGTLNYGGKSYRFAVGDVAIFGIGAATFTADGEVYRVKKPQDFSGVYADGHTWSTGAATSPGELWLQNQDGVILHLKPKQTGLTWSPDRGNVSISMQ
jgi:hypothetical protein